MDPDTDKPRQRFEPPPRADLARSVARLSTEYVLRLLRLLTDMQDGELLTAIIGQAIIAANTSHLNEAADPERRFAGRMDLPPDELRRPISVLALSASLGLPFETTRRHVNKLMAAGVCKRVRGGVIIPAEALDNPRSVAAGEANLTYVLQFVRGLRRLGLDID